MEAACSKKFNTILDAISDLTNDELNAKIEEHKKTCFITDADRETANAKIDAVETERKQRVAELHSEMQRSIKAGEQFNVGRYDEAYKLASDNAIAAEALEIKTQHKPGDLTAAFLAELSWYGLFARQYTRALDASERSLKLKATLTEEKNQAHALMLLGRAAAAKAIYLAHNSETIQDKTWQKAIVEDFVKLRKAGIESPLMAEIESAFPKPPWPIVKSMDHRYVPEGYPCHQGEAGCLYCPSDDRRCL